MNSTRHRTYDHSCRGYPKDRDRGGKRCIQIQGREDEDELQGLLDTKRYIQRVHCNLSPSGDPSIAIGSPCMVASIIELGPCSLGTPDITVKIPLVLPSKVASVVASMVASKVASMATSMATSIAASFAATVATFLVEEVESLAFLIEKMPWEFAFVSTVGCTTSMYICRVLWLVL